MKGKNKDEMKKMCCCVKRMERTLVNGVAGLKKLFKQKYKV